MADKQQRGNREAKKPKKAKPRSAPAATGLGIIDKAREWSTLKR